MSHSQFHCTGRAYLDMHGLIFETSICYWQDQPGRSAVSHERRASDKRTPGLSSVGWPGSPEAHGEHTGRRWQGPRAAAAAAGGGRGTAGRRRRRGRHGGDPETPAGTTDPDPSPHARSEAGRTPFSARPTEPERQTVEPARGRARGPNSLAPHGGGADTRQSGARGPPARARDRGRTTTATAAAATAGNPRGAACTGTRRGRARGGP